jgi:hypothetical protein
MGNGTQDATNSSQLDTSTANILVSLATLQYPLSGEYQVLKHGRATHSFEAHSSLFPYNYVTKPATSSEHNSTCWYGQPLSPVQLQEALDIGRKELEVVTAHLDRNSPSYRHQMAMRTGPEATKLAQAGYVLNLATRHLADR